MSTPRIRIVGVGDDGRPGLTQQALDAILSSPMLLGNESLLDRFPEYKGTKVAIGPDLDRLACALETAPENAVLLASGDPLFLRHGSVSLRTTRQRAL